MYVGNIILIALDSDFEGIPDDNPITSKIYSAATGVFQDIWTAHFYGDRIRRHFCVPG